jgi:hypothetical protein
MPWVHLRFRQRLRPAGRQPPVDLHGKIIEIGAYFLGPPLAGCQHMVGRDAINPCRKSALLPKGRQMGRNLDQNLLGRIFRIDGIAQHSDRQSKDAVFDLQQDFRQRFPVAFSCRFHQSFRIRSHKVS